MRSDINGAFDEMVEALEENEDMVECKECFDLFPKAECEKSAVGFVCPTCKGRKVMPTRPAFEDPFDCYTQDFPEVADYDPDSVVEYEVEPSLGDALDDLIKDEYDAINGYEVADEKIQHTSIPEDDKDEILDTLDHIKEEEEEHIDELKDLCPECDPEKEDTKENLTESAGEPKIYYIYADDLYVDDLGFMEAMDINEVIREAEIRYGSKYHPEDLYVEEAEPEILADLVPSDFIIPPKHFKFNEALTEAETPELPEEESEENENEEVSDLESAYDAALEVANDKGVGQVFGYATEEDESFVAIDLFDVDDAEAVEDDLRAVYDNVKYAYVAYPEKKLDEVLHEGLFDIVAQKKLEKICPNGFKIVSLPRGAGAADGKTVPNMANGMKLAKAASKQVPTATWGIMISDKDRENLKNSDTTPENIKDVFAKSNWVVARFKNGKELENQISDILKNYKDIAKKNAKVDKLMGQADAGQTRADREQARADARAQRERDKQDAAQARADAAEQSDRERAELAAGDGETDAVTTPTDTTATSTDLGAAGDTTTETTTETTSETDTTDTTETDTTETDTTETPEAPETPETPETPAAEPAEDTKKADQAKRIKDGFKTLGKDLSDEAVEKLRAILFAESYHGSLTEAVDPADFAGTWRGNLLFVYKAEDTSGANGFAVAFPKESGIRGYAAIAAEIAAGKYTEDSAKAYEEAINKFKTNLGLTPNTEGVTIDQWSEKCNAYFKEAEDLLKPVAAPEAAAATPDATPDASGDTPEAPAAKAGKVSAQKMSQMRANQKKIYNAIVSDPELKDLAAKLYVDGTNKAGKKVKKATPELKALRKAIFGESFDAEVNEELQSDAEAVKSIKNTAALLQDTAKSMQNMTAAMKD